MTENLIVIELRGVICNLNWAYVILLNKLHWCSGFIVFLLCSFARKLLILLSLFYVLFMCFSVLRITVALLSLRHILWLWIFPLFTGIQIVFLDSGWTLWRGVSGEVWKWEDALVLLGRFPFRAEIHRMLLVQVIVSISRMLSPHYCSAR